MEMKILRGKISTKKGKIVGIEFFSQDVVFSLPPMERGEKKEERRLTEGSFILYNTKAPL